MSDYRDKELEERNRLTPHLHESLQGLVGSGMMTGYLVVMEYLDEDGDYQSIWLTGTGSTPEPEQEGGLPHHRVAGLLWKAQADVDNHYRSSWKRSTEGEE